MSKLDVLLNRLNKKYGGDKPLLGMGTSDNLIINTPKTSTGVQPLDKALKGGIPLGKIIQIAGPSRSGKSTLTHNIVATYQENKKKVIYFDLEYAVDWTWAKKIGVNVEELIVINDKDKEGRVILHAEKLFSLLKDIIPVSYTHLTLPTILLV